jgi:hypothetical protein
MRASLQINRKLSVTLGLLLAGLGTEALAQGRQARTIDLFAREPARARGGPQELPGMRPEAVGAVAYFAISPEANSSLRAARRGTLRLRIALPKGRPVVCTFAAEEGKDGVMSGRIEGSGTGDRCDVVFEGGQVTGDIDIASGRYRIVPVGQGDVHAVVEIRSEAFPNESDSPIPPDRPPADAQPRMQRDSRFCDVKPSAVQRPPVLGPVRVMILYTPAARGQSANIQADVRLLMAQLKEATSLTRTGGNFFVAVELAYAQEVNYIEAAKMKIDLDRLTDTRDPVFGPIHDLRDRYKADLVHLLIKSRPGDSCGIGWLNPQVATGDARYGFSVSDRECAINNYSFSHELGHNFGMNHDRGVVNNASQDQFNFGYVSFAQGTRSLMAYNDACASQNKNCRRLLYYSSPLVRVNGVVFGRSAMHPEGGAYNIEILCRAAPIVANFR